jgi:hypothetical protein
MQQLEILVTITAVIIVLIKEKTIILMLRKVRKNLGKIQEIKSLKALGMLKKIDLFLEVKLAIVITIQTKICTHSQSLTPKKKNLKKAKSVQKK